MNESHPSIYSGATAAQVAESLANLLDLQAEGLSLAELETMIAADLLPHLMRYDQPRFQSTLLMLSTKEALLGARVELDFNQGVTNWQVSPGGAMLEELCGQALCRLFASGPDADATFMYSGTYGNQQALYMALHRHAQREGFDLAQKGIAGFAAPERLTILAAEGAHFSLKQAVRMLGLGEQSLIWLPLDARWRIDTRQARAIVRQLQPRRKLVCIVATAGTTSTGAVDPISALADLSLETGAWLHVDGAYGYAYKLVPEWSHLFAGDDRADSITWDPHKQLGAPIPNSLLFVRQREDFERMAIHSHYFNRAATSEPNPGLKSPPSTRPMSALPLLAILRGRGLSALVNDLRAPVAAVRDLAAYIQSLPEVELFHEPDTGILCFRMTPPGLTDQELDALQINLYARIMASGERSISTTNLGGKQVLRLVIVSPQTTFVDLRETIDEISKIVRTA